MVQIPTWLPDPLPMSVVDSVFPLSSSPPKTQIAFVE